MKTMMKELESLEELQLLCEKEKTTILTFSADWCPDCMFIKPFLPQLIEKYNDYTFIYIDTTKFPQIAKEYDIMGIPSFVAIKSDVEISRFVSKARKSKQEIDDFLSTCQ